MTNQRKKNQIRKQIRNNTPNIIIDHNSIDDILINDFYNVFNKINNNDNTQNKIMMDIFLNKWKEIWIQLYENQKK
tara:strand:- start:747 stop:974 length:228 start_codon:yes stop_codon:yes gene_type:complete